MSVQKKEIGIMELTGSIKAKILSFLLTQGGSFMLNWYLKRKFPFDGKEVKTNNTKHSIEIYKDATVLKFETEIFNKGFYGIRLSGISLSFSLGGRPYYQKDILANSILNHNDTVKLFKELRIAPGYIKPIEDFLDKGCTSDIKVAIFLSHKFGTEIVRKEISVENTKVKIFKCSVNG